MTIANIARKNGPFVGDAVTTTFPYSFRIFTAAEIEVFQNDTDVSPALFTVTGVNSDTGGNVIFTTAPATGDIVWIFGDTTKEQETSYPPTGPFPALSHETGLDRSIMVLWEFEEELERRPGLKQSTLTALRNLEFPSPGANPLIGWNADKTALTLFPSQLDLVTPTSVSGEIPNQVTRTITFTNGDVLASDAQLIGMIPPGNRVNMVSVEVQTTIGGATTFSVGGMGMQDGWGAGILTAALTINKVPRRGDQPFAISAEDIQIIAEGAPFDGTGSLKIRAHLVAYSPQ